MRTSVDPHRVYIKLDGSPHQPHQLPQPMANAMSPQATRRKQASTAFGLTKITIAKRLNSRIAESEFGIYRKRRSISNKEKHAHLPSSVLAIFLQDFGPGELAE